MRTRGLLGMTDAGPHGRSPGFHALEPRELAAGAIFAAVRDGIVVADADGRIVLWNAAASAIFGYDAREALGQQVETLVPERLRARHRAGMERWRRTYRGPYLDAAGFLELPALRKDGTEIRVEMTLSNVTGPHREALVLAVVRDVTEAWHTRAALTESEERFRVAFEQASVGMALIRPDGSFEQVNERFAEIVGRSKEDMAGLRFQDITHPDDVAQDLTALADMLAGRRASYSREKRYVRRSGAPVWIQVTVTLIRDAAGEPIRFLSVVEDIDHRKRAEQALRESEERFRSVFETAPIGMALTTLAGRYFRVNGRFSEIVGYTEDELKDLTVRDLTHPEDRETDAELSRNVERGERSWFQIEKRYVRKDGHVLHVLLSKSLLRDRNGSPLYFISQVQDVTERVELTQDLERERDRLRTMNRALTRSNEALEAFTYVVSHDLKEPTRAIEAYLTALEEDHSADLGEEGRVLAERSRLAAQRLGSLLKGLLEFSRATRGGLEVEPVRVVDVLEDEMCISRYQTLIEERRADIRVDDDIPPVLATMPALCQVFGNLIVNAIRHNASPRPSIHVRHVSEGTREGLVEIAVEDNGPGFSPAVIQRAETLSGPMPSQSGGGFGLVIARRAVEHMGGHMRLTNRPEGGASVRIALRAAE